MTPHSRIPYHGPPVEGAQDRDNFVRNLITVLGGMWPAANGEGAATSRPLSKSAKDSTPVLTLDQIKLHCHIEPDQTAEDSLLQTFEMAARIHTQNILRRAFDDTVGENVKLAMLVLISHWYRNRETASPQKFAEVPLAYTALLWPERDFSDGEGSGSPPANQGPPGPPGPAGPEGPAGAPATIAYGAVELPHGTLPTWPATAVLLNVTVQIPATGQYAVEVRCGITVDSTSGDDIVTAKCNGRQQSINFGRTQGVGGILSEFFAFTIPATPGAFPVKLEVGADSGTLPYFGADDATQWSSHVTWAVAEVKP